ncbi:MAG TPA: ribonucleoside-diphosphate reductase subunit alpha [Ilumatobacter sp.]|nr:ribonucleoside-diphosphate reductase subunit alpha [Ilumatobacter sp.]
MTILDGDGGSGTALETPPSGIPSPITRLAPVASSPAAPAAPHGMQVRKRNGALEPVDVNKIVNAIAKAAEGLRGVDPMRVATRTISALADGATTRQLDDLSIRTAAGLIVEEPAYSKLAGRLLATVIDKEVRNQGIPWFSESIDLGHAVGIVSDEVQAFVAANAPSLNAAIDSSRDRRFEFFGLRTVYDRYLLRHPERREVTETPQYFFLRVACGLSQNVDEAIAFYDLMSTLAYLPSSPTLFNSGTTHSQMSSCFVAGTPVFTVNRGLVAIEDVEVGDETVTHTGATATVTQLHRNPLGDRALWDLTVSGLPDTVTATGNHRFWAAHYDRKRGTSQPGWVAADDLRVGDYVALAEGHDLKGDVFSIFPGEHAAGRFVFGEPAADGMMPVSVRWASRDHLNGTDATIVRSRAMSPVRAEWFFDAEQGARFLGQWFGDGTVLKGRGKRPVGISLVFADKERALAERWARTGEQIFGVTPRFHDDPARNWSSVSFHSAVIGEAFQATFGTYSNERRLPDGFYRMGREFVVGFLKGLIEADGCVTTGRSVSVTLTNLELVTAVAAWGRTHGLPITSAAVPKYEDGPFRRQASLRVPAWALDLTDLGKVYDDDRIDALAGAQPSTHVQVIDGRAFMRVNAKAPAARVDTVYNLGVAHDDHSYSVNGLSVANCYLLDSPEDSLEGIYKRYTDVARLSKFAGGIGVSWSRVRAKGSLIRGTNGLSNGIVPWLRTLDSSVAAVNQGGRRKGAACVYLETWHADIEDFLELRDNTGDHARRTHHLNLANWVPDLFMERVEKDWQWSLFDPKKVPHLVDLYGDEFAAAYQAAEEAGLYEKQIPARQLYSRMMRTLAQTGNGWMTFKDPANEKCNQTGGVNDDGSPRVVHLSNLCTEILEVTDQANTAVCNLGSLNLGAYMLDPTEPGKPPAFDFTRLGEVVRQVVPFLDRVIDINYYPTPEAQHSNHQWRPVGLGVMGLQDVFFKMGVAFDSPEAQEMSTLVQAHIYFHALWASTELAAQHGPHATYAGTRAADGKLQFDLWGVTPPAGLDWDGLRARIAQHGLRNSLLIAIAPTATIASIAGCYECIEPQVSNLFKRETLSGEFMQINRYLVADLQARGLWDDEMIAAIKRADGSVQDIDRIPAQVRAVYRTAWEIPQRNLIDMGASRGAYIDQSQSLNLFMETPTIGKLSSMYLHAWKSGLKTTYYLRSRPATRIAQATVSGDSTPTPTPPAPKKEFTDDEAVACSLENPEHCDACQ